MADPLSMLGDDPDDYPVDSFRVNKTFSGHYDVWRQKEEMQKLKDLKNNMSDSSSESESEEEPVIERDFLKALSLLKSDDPRIYSEDVELFKEDDQEVKKKPKVKKEKPMLMKDYERELVLKTNGELSDDEYRVPDEEQLTVAEEEVRQRKAELPILMAEDSEDEDLFREKTKGKVEEEKEEAEYLQFLKGEKEEVKEDVKELSYLQKYWNDPKLDQDEKFLRDYILNEKFVVKDKSDMNLNYGGEMMEDMEMLSDDEKIVQQQEQFEQKYNFRFEEPDTEFIKRYPRTIGDSLRREDTRRKMKREEYAERKQKEKDQKREELKRLKALKRKEIEEKFLKLKEVSGQEELNFDEGDIESDFDPDKHDRKMKELFNDDYYTVAEEQKPEFEYDEELDDEKWDLWTREPNKGNGTSSKADGNEDDSSADEVSQEINAKQQFEQEMVDSTRVGGKKGKKKSLFAKIVSQPKPIFDPDGKSFDDYLDEYYKMDFEDVIGDLPVRFKYRKVVPNDFGLSIDEILTANDKELNQWCSVKKTCQYRHEDEEKYDVQAFQKKAQNTVVKQKVLSSLYALPNEGEETQVSNAEQKEGSSKSKRRRKKKKKNAAVSEEDHAKESLASEIEVKETPVTETNQLVESDAINTNLKSKKKKKKSKNLLQESSITGSSFQIAEDTTISTEEVLNTSPNVDVSVESKSLNKKSKRKRKKANANTSGGFEISSLDDSRNDDVLPSVYQLNNSAKNADSSQSEAAFSYLDSSSKTLNGSKIKNKTKRKLEDSMDISNLDNDHVKKKKKDNEHEDDTTSNETQKQDSTNPTHEETATNVNQSTKKSKKKKSKNNQDFSSRKPYNQGFSTRNFPSGSKTQSKIPEADKKLALPNSRLASYGLNPKKFKNSIIYSK